LMCYVCAPFFSSLEMHVICYVCLPLSFVVKLHKMYFAKAKMIVN
jgi:hypothetical protein